MKEKAGITRRDFLKLSGAGMAGTLLSGIHLENIEAIGNGPNALEIEKKIPASQITILEYHYPGYEGAGITLPKELFEVQMDYLVSARYKTLTDKELAGFIQKGSFESVKSTVLRIDQGAAHFDEFEWMMGILKSKKLHPIVFISAGESFTDEQWKKLARWYKEGSISIGSHSVTHPNFKNITDEEAFGEAINSKKMIEKKLASVDAKIKIIGFSFPFDSVPENTNFLKRAGYSFGIGGVMERTENNAAKEGQFILPSTYPYMNTSQLDLNKQNNNVFMGAVPLTGGETFDEKMILSGTYVTASMVEKFTGQTCEPVYFGKYLELPENPRFGNRIARARKIVIHNAGQNGDFPERWTSQSTYYGLLGRQLDAHFGVGVDGVFQFKPVYKNGFASVTTGTKGMRDCFSIEMGGRDFDRIMDPRCNPEIKKAIELITDQTIDLIRNLIDVCPWIDVTEDIVGHNEVTATTKPDPGFDYMTYLRGRLYKSFGVRSR